MVVSRGDLFNSPDHHLHSFDGEDAVFVPMDRAAYHRSIFLDARISPAANGTLRLPLQNLAAEGAFKPIGWIFHLAHCGSTLLARALDDPKSNLVLREPMCLREVSLNYSPARVALVKAMLGKRYCAQAPSLVKASVPVNFILPQLLTDAGDVRAIFLHCPLRDYLLAVLRTPGHRDWIARVTGLLASHLGDLTGSTDAERGAALWLAQMRAFEKAMAHNAATVSLDCEIFFGTPRPVLAAACAYLDVAMTDRAIEKTVAGPLFANHAKMPAHVFDNAMRLARRSALEDELAPELDVAARWVMQAGGGPLLPRPLS